MKSLFTECRLERGPARDDEPHFDYLCRTGRPSFVCVRETMEAWWRKIPHPHRPKLAGRLRNRDDHHFEAAFFELYLHRLFHSLGYWVKLHPRLSGTRRRPDFELRRGAGRGMLVEATTIAEYSEQERAIEARRKLLYATLNTIHNPKYLIALHEVGDPAASLARRAKRELQRHLNILHHESVQQATRLGRNLPYIEIEHEGGTLRLSVIAAEPGSDSVDGHRLIGKYPARAEFIDWAAELRQKAESKAGRYGKRRRPLVLAVNCAGRHLSGADICGALFGTGSWGGTSSPSSSFFGSALAPRHSRISAVLVVSSLLPWTVANFEPVMCFNPWARYPITREFRKLRKITARGERVVERGGVAIRQLLSLPAALELRD